MIGHLWEYKYDGDDKKPKWWMVAILRCCVASSNIIMDINGKEKPKVIPLNWRKWFKLWPINWVSFIRSSKMYQTKKKVLIPSVGISLQLDQNWRNFNTLILDQSKNNFNFLI